MGWQNVEEDTLDNDNIADEIEGASPNEGDANDDGFPDNDQSNDASFVNVVSNKYATLVVPDTCTIENVGANAETDFGGLLDASYSYSSGLLGFNVNCGVFGATVTFEEYFFETGKTAKDFVARKFTPYNNTYQNLPGATLIDVTIGGKAAIKLLFSLTDGGPFDSDQSANGTILDPAGLGTAEVTAVIFPRGTLPATGNGAGTTTLIVTSLVLIFVGLIAIKKYRSKAKV